MTAETKPFTDRASRLLAEFHKKIESLLADLECSRSKAAAMPDGEKLQGDAWRVHQEDYGLLQRRIHQLEPALDDLARTVSQRIEHGELDELERLELRLRLAEYEASLMELRTMAARPITLSV